MLLFGKDDFKQKESIISDKQSPEQKEQEVNTRDREVNAENQKVNTKDTEDIKGTKETKDIKDIKEKPKKKEVKKNTSTTSTVKAKKVKNLDCDDSEETSRKLRDLKQITIYSSIEERLLKQFKNGSLHHAIMLSGDFGIGKATFAYWMISRFLLLKEESADNSKQRIDMHIELLEKNIHPDVVFLDLNENENEIKIEQIRQFFAKIIFKSTYGNKFVIIDDINSVNTNGINALLKTLEEPPENTFFFIINHKTSRVLDTIYSRCNEIKMTISNEECIKILQQIHKDWDLSDIRFYAQLASNSIGFAEMLYALKAKDLILKENCVVHANVHELLNNLYKKIESQFKTISKELKISLLERVLFYLVNFNIATTINANKEDDSSIYNRQLIRQNNNLLKQLADIKIFDLPVRFYKK